VAAVGKGCFLAGRILVAVADMAPVAVVGRGCFLAGHILVAVVDMAQPVDIAAVDMARPAGTAAAPGMSARTDLVVDTADKVGRAVRQRLRRQASSHFSAAAFSAWGRPGPQSPGSGR
jgi:hypothetical protein